MWHYREADPDLGAWQAKELLDHLEGVLANEPVEVISGQSIVEVKPQVRRRQAVGRGSSRREPEVCPTPAPCHLTCALPSPASRQLGLSVPR